MARGDPEGTRPPTTAPVSGIAADSPPVPETHTVDPREPRRARVLACGLGASACAAAAGLLAGSAALPPVVPFVALVAVLAVVVNRGALYPSEVASTAENAVLFAAVVAFRTDSPLLGPLALALMIGPLDALHWRQRRFVRMAYNSGAQGLAILAGAFVFQAVWDALGPASMWVVVAAAIAALGYAAVDLAAGTLLLVALGTDPVIGAARHVLTVVSLAVPLAVVGAVAALLATGVGWWAGLVVLAPVPWLPELILVRTRSHRLLRRFVVGPGAVLALVVGLAAVSPGGRVAGALLLVAGAGLLGTELHARRCLVPALSASVVVATAIVVPDAALWAGVAGGLVALVAGAGRPWARRAAGVAVAVAAGTAAAVMTGIGEDAPMLATVVAAVGGAVVYEAFVLAPPFRAGRDVVADALWSAPLVGGAIALALVWNDSLANDAFERGAVGAVFVVGTTAAFVSVAWTAAPPWESRYLGRGLPRRAACHLAALAMLCALALALGAGGALAGVGDVRTACVHAAAWAAEVTAAVVAASVRQWRFAPRRLVVEAGAVLAAATVVLCLYMPAALDGHAVAWVVLLVAVVLIGCIGWAPARLIDRSVRVSGSSSARAERAAR